MHSFNFLSIDGNYFAYVHTCQQCNKTFPEYTYFHFAVSSRQHLNYLSGKGVARSLLLIGIIKNFAVSLHFGICSKP